MRHIIKQLEALREHPEPDEQVLADAASYVREANDIAIQQGVDPVRVGKYLRPIEAIAMVNRLMQVVEPERFLGVPEAAKVLSVSPTKVTELIKSGRLEAVDVANRGKRPQYRIARESLSNVKPVEYTPVRRYKPPKQII